MIETRTVDKVFYAEHMKRGARPDHPKTLRVTYRSGGDEVSEYVCVEHDGYAREKAEAWWDERSLGAPIPDTVAEAVRIARAGGLRMPATIQIETADGWPTITPATWAKPTTPTLPVYRKPVA